eukprot:gene19588-26271_t
MNVEVVQTEIRYRVYQETKIVIGKQSEFELSGVLLAIYLQHGKHLDTNLAEQIRELNEHVYNYCVRTIVSNLLQYQRYISEVGKNPVPLARGGYESSAGTRSREFKSF